MVDARRRAEWLHTSPVLFAVRNILRLQANSLGNNLPEVLWKDCDPYYKEPVLSPETRKELWGELGEIVKEITK